MILKSLTAGVAAAALIGAAAIGATTLSMVSAPVAAANPAVADVPLQPGAPVPSAAELTQLLTSLASPGVSFSNKGYLIENGVGIIEGKTADRLLSNAAADGYLPLSFNVANITSPGPGLAAATVTASGPQLAPVTQNVTFVNQAGAWKLSRASATSLLQAALG